MGLSATLVNVTANELVYLINNVSAEGSPPGTTLTIGNPALTIACTVDGWGRAACPRLRAVCDAGDNGLGLVAAGGWTQALARDLFLGNGATQAGGPLMPRAEIDLQPVDGVAGGCLAEANVDVDGDGKPVIVITTVAVVGRALLRIRLRSSPGVR